MGEFMKKFYFLIYIVFIILVFISGFYLYSVKSKKSSQNKISEKVLSEISFLEKKFVDMFNDLNNITFENYSIKITEIDQKESEKNDEKSSSDKSRNEDENKSEESEKINENEKNSKYEMVRSGILTDEKKNIDWSKIKNDVEDIYKLLYPLTLDLYKTDVNYQDIINFNNEYDNLTVLVKEENKQAVLDELSVLYDYIPGFVDKCTEDEKEKSIIKIKNYVLKAYSVLDKDEWKNISDNINDATNETAKLLTDVNNQENINQYSLNRMYIILNEMQNSVELKDKQVFLIKYKNILEDLINM